MKAEIVWADQIKAGDQIQWFNSIYRIERIDVIHGCGMREIHLESGTKLVKFDADFVARILPDPVEEREEWRATCGHVTTYGSEIQVRTWADWQNGPVTIEHVRETVLSREEVKND